MSTQVLISFPVMCGTFAGYNHLTYPYKGDTYNLWDLSQARKGQPICIILIMIRPTALFPPPL